MSQGLCPVTAMFLLHRYESLLMIYDVCMIDKLDKLDIHEVFGMITCMMLLIVRWLLLRRIMLRKIETGIFDSYDLAMSALWMGVQVKRSLCFCLKVQNCIRTCHLSLDLQLPLVVIMRDLIQQSFANLARRLLFKRSKGKEWWEENVYLESEITSWWNISGSTGFHSVYNTELNGCIPVTRTRMQLLSNCDRSAVQR